MKDKVSIERIKLLHPAIIDKVTQALEAAEALLPADYAIRIVQGYRTFEQQEKLYQQGRTTEGKKVTNAKPGQSYHNYGLAIDFCILRDLDGNGSYETVSWKVDSWWVKVAMCFEKYGFQWGGRWSKLVDNPHLEMTFGYSWKTLLGMHRLNTFIKGTNYVNLT